MLVLPILSIGLAAFATAAFADNRIRDLTYADTFGNIIIDSASGYKRIVVGQGRIARRLAEGPRKSEPKIAQSEPGAPMPGEPYCYAPPVLVKGRSYMYGFSEGILPTLGASCQ
jgi:hypothetical protein